MKRCLESLATHIQKNTNENQNEILLHTHWYNHNKRDKNWQGCGILECHL